MPPADICNTSYYQWKCYRLLLSCCFDVSTLHVYCHLNLLFYVTMKLRSRFLYSFDSCFLQCNQLLFKDILIILQDMTINVQFQKSPFQIENRIISIFLLLFLLFKSPRFEEIEHAKRNTNITTGEFFWGSWINTIASHDQFKPIRIGEYLAVNYNGLNRNITGSFGRTRNALGSWVNRRVFPQLFQRTKIILN